MGRIGPCKATASVVRELFAIARSRRVNHDTLSGVILINRAQISKWHTGRHTPNVLNVENLAQALGYRLVLAPIEEPASAVSEIASKTD